MRGILAEVRSFSGKVERREAPDGGNKCLLILHPLILKDRLSSSGLGSSSTTITEGLGVILCLLFFHFLFFWVSTKSSRPLKEEAVPETIPRTLLVRTQETGP